MLMVYLIVIQVIYLSNSSSYQFSRQNAIMNFRILYDLLKTGMVGGPSIVFCRYAEKDATKIRPHIYGDEAKTCKSVVGFDANSLYLYCLGDEMPCGKEEYAEVKNPKDPETIGQICKDVINGDLFGSGRYICTRRIKRKV